MKKIFKFNFKAVLIMFALIPLLIGGTIVSTVSVGTSQKEIKKTTNTSILALANGVGTGINDYVSSCEGILKTFTTAPIVKDVLLNPNDANIQAKAQQYTLDFFEKLEGWEGIYIADWNSKVLTHPTKAVIGKVMREGDALKSLQDSITNSENGLNWIKIGDAPSMGKYITKTAEKIKPEGLSKTREVHPGDLILSNSMSFGRPYILKIDGAVHDGWLILSNYNKVFDKNYLYYLLSSNVAMKQFLFSAMGSTVKNLNSARVANTIGVVPPISEQRRIVARIEQLFTLLN